MDYDSEENGDMKDLWNTEPCWNAKESSSCKVEIAEPVKRTRKVQAKSNDMAEKYRNAWKEVYESLPEWRKKEIDIQMKSGRLSDKSYDTEFARRVAVLAEKQ